MLRLIFPILCVPLASLLALPPTELAARQRSPSLTLESVNDAAWEAQGKSSTALLVKLQVLLDRLTPRLARSMALWVRTPARQSQPMLR